MSYTPGPWTLGWMGGYGKGGVFSPAFEDGKEPLASVRFPAKYERGTLTEEAMREAEANASLIVRAVNCHEELLGACKEALRFIENYPENWALGTQDMIERAIAKAEGR